MGGMGDTTSDTQANQVNNIVNQTKEKISQTNRAEIAIVELAYNLYSIVTTNSLPKAGSHNKCFSSYSKLKGGKSNTTPLL